MFNVEEQQPNKKINIRLIVGILAILIIIAGFFFLQTARGAYSKESAEADRLNSAGDYAGAQNFLLEKIKTDSAPELKLILANSYLKEGDARGTKDSASFRTRDLLLGVENSGYASANLYYLLGYSSEIISDFNRAIEYYNKAVSIDSKSIRSMLGIGRIYWFNGDAVKAKEYYDNAEKAITWSTDKSIKAEIYSAQGRANTDPEKSEKYFLKALSLASSKTSKLESYADLSNAKYLQGDLSKAVEYADLAIQTDTSSELGYTAYARAVISDADLFQENVSKVNENLVKAIFLAYKKAEPHHQMGRFYFFTGDYDMAIKSYDTARSLVAVDASSGKLEKDALAADILFDESVAYFMKKDNKYTAFLKEAYKYNPTKTFYLVDTNPELKEMRTALIKSDLFLMATYKI